MAGRPRKRRSSNSTVATVDDSRIRWTKESAVLKPVPRDVPDGQWPCYVLADATVYMKDGKTLANPLLVGLEGPFIVRGLLEVDDEYLENLVRPSVRSAYIEISHSDNYSFGDGPVVIWASGASGWFEIRPSAKYQSMFNQAREAVTLYYSVFDAYEEYRIACGGKKKSKRPDPPTLDQIFFKYALKVGDGIVRDEVEALCHKWAAFLIGHFPKEDNDGWKWDETLFYKWLRDSHPELVKRYADIAKGVVAPPPLPAPPPSQSQSIDENDVPGGRRSRSVKGSARSSEAPDVERRDPAPHRSRSPQAKPAGKGKARISETPIPIPDKYRQFSQPGYSKAAPAPAPPAASLTPSAPEDTPRDTPVSGADSNSPLDQLLSAIEEIALEKGTTNLPKSTVNKGVYLKCKVRDYHNSSKIVAYFAKGILARLGPEWEGGPWYEWLKETARQPRISSQQAEEEDIPGQAIRRAKILKPVASTKSATQLPPSIGLKAKTRKVARPESEEDSDDDFVGSRMRGRRSGKAATLRLVSSSKKRPPPEVDEPANGRGRGRKSLKTAHRASDDEDDAEDDMADDAADDDDDDDNAADTGEYDVPATALPEGAVRVVLRAERLPTASPTGPNGSWVCEHEGCTYVVRAAEEQASQELIREHFRHHEAEAERISLALKESRGGHMPINHLLDKIQAIGKAALLKKRKTLNGELLPEPVKRRTLV
ncbi:hypothetical protein VTK26DRAFT_754 [Humicola hyalothermophila]